MFKDKVVLITGASRGIGRAIAFEFGKQQATVIVNFKSNETEAMKVVEEIISFGGRALAVKADISNYEELKRMAESVVGRFKKVDILVNNAGIIIDRSFEEMTYEESLSIFKTNTLAPLYLSKMIAPSMLENGGGKIINLSSTSGMYDFNPDTADYAMSKLAIQSLTKDLSLKYSPLIRVNAVAPAWVNTDMNKDLPREVIKQGVSKSHLQRMAEPKEIADAVVYLASDKSSYVTGQVLVLDGGHC